VLALPLPQLVGRLVLVSGHTCMHVSSTVWIQVVGQMGTLQHPVLLTVVPGVPLCRGHACQLHRRVSGLLAPPPRPAHVVSAASLLAPFVVA
jgi:hypothetical protein